MIIIKQFRKTFYNNAFYMHKTLLQVVEIPVMFDVSAHYGETCFESNELFDKCVIHTFGSFKQSFDVLFWSIKKFVNIKAHNMTSGNMTGEINFHINPYSATNSILPTHKKGAGTW